MDVYNYRCTKLSVSEMFERLNIDVLIRKTNNCVFLSLKDNSWVFSLLQDELCDCKFTTSTDGITEIEIPSLERLVKLMQKEFYVPSELF